MTQETLIKGYQEEIAYQKRMLANLSRWFRICFILASISCALIYGLTKEHIIGYRLSWIMGIISVLGMVLIGYGIYKGRLNLQRVIDDFERKLHRLS
ncbi:DUF202 domain-containing protein [Streptococcus sp. zg-JUN1979]|uniref:DUF202 domain-containing protein n=1 Tax=Streptococcus sp. zg-JUN1979 TaxID=3391450 RepID=UPI0039AFE92E